MVSLVCVCLFLWHDDVQYSPGGRVKKVNFESNEDRARGKPSVCVCLFLRHDDVLPGWEGEECYHLPRHTVVRHVQRLLRNKIKHLLR